jgi:hypothetical protein
MSADYTGECPSCGAEETFKEYYQFYFEVGALHAEFSGECEHRWGGCGFSFSHDFEPYPIPVVT